MKSRYFSLWNHVKLTGTKTKEILCVPLEPCQTDWYQNRVQIRTSTTYPLEPCQTDRYQNYFTIGRKNVPPLEPCQTDWYQNLGTSPYIGKVGDTIPIVARKLLRMMKSSLHCFPESRINTSHLSVQSE